MYDLHFDLLTYIYINKSSLNSIKKRFKKLFRDSMTGGIFNLFYMSEAEMNEELEISKDEIDIIKNLEEVNRIVNEENLIPNHINYVYGIEGLDYLKDINDIEILYNLGVRSVNIVWNNDNKFGGGAKGNKDRGLTDEGKKLVRKLVDVGIAIDLSHANEKTFYNIVDLLDELPSNVVKKILNKIKF